MEKTTSPFTEEQLLRYFLFRQASLEKFIKDKRKKKQFLSSYVLKRQTNPGLRKRNTMRPSLKTNKIKKELTKLTTCFVSKGYNDIIDGLKERGFQEEEDPEKINQTDFIYVIKVKDINFKRLSPSTITNHIHNTSELTRKDTLTKSLKFFNLLDKDTNWFFTIAFEANEKTEFEDFFDYYKLNALISFLKSYSTTKEPTEEETLKAELALKLAENKMNLLEEFCANFFNEAFESKETLLISEREWCHFNKEKPEKYQAEMTKIRKKLNLPQEEFVSSSLEELVESKPELTSRIQEFLEKYAQLNPQSKIAGTDNIWIMKPSSLSRGRGIQIFRNLKDILFTLRTSCENYLVNKYIENPLLILNRK